MAMSDYLCFTAQEANSTITLNRNGSPSWTGSYSTDSKNWTSYTLGTKLTLTNAGDKVYFKGTLSADQSRISYLQFEISGEIAASGNLNSLHYEDDYLTRTKLNYTYEYYSLFEDCIDLTQAPGLPATTLTEYCYSDMFYICASLTQAPELPATTLADHCYYNMFGRCTSLTQAPELSATTLATYCYSNMFWRCTSLTQAPELPATTLAAYCYQGMFTACMSLTQAPELPATTLADHCYGNMFQGCTGLIQAPKLPATILAENCYNRMFIECANLTQAPELPATTLAKYCYSNMFQDCVGLIQAPELPATTLADYCYYSMFFGCTKLKFSTTQTSKYNTPYRIPTSGTGTEGIQSLINIFTNTGGTFTDTPNINTTYYMCIPASSALNIKYGEISIEKVYLGTTEITDFHYGE